MQLVHYRAVTVAAAFLFSATAACETVQHRQTVYDRGGVQIALERDPSIADASLMRGNSHPASLRPEEIHHLLGLIEVTGYSGTLVGIFANPSPRPLFDPEELDVIAEPLAVALARASAQDRVLFSLPNRRAAYEQDRTAGAVFVREPYLFVLLTDHAAYTRTDTGGGDVDRDPFPDKGLRLRTVSPAKAAVLSPEQEPRWRSFERVHVAVNIRDALLVASSSPPSSPPVVSQAPVPPPAGVDRSEGLRLVIRELTNANQDLRSRLQDQSQQIERLQQDLATLRQRLQERARKPAQHRNGSPTSREDLTQP